MFELDIAKIRELAGDLVLLNKGFKLYQNKDNIQFNAYTDEFYPNIIYYEAIFSDSTFAKIVVQNQTISGICQCCDKKKYCEHQIALLFLIKDDNYEILKKKQDPKLLLHTKLRDTFIEFEKANTIHYSHNLSTIDVIVRQEKDSFLASFRIGDKKKYKINDLYEFVNNYITKNNQVFGKDFETNFFEKDFTELGNQVAQFIVSVANYAGIKKELPLSKMTLEYLITMFENKEIYFLNNGSETIKKVITKDPQINFKYVNNQLVLEIDEPYYYVTCINKSFYIYKDNIYIVSKEFHNKHSVLLKFLQENSYKIEIDKQVEEDFMSRVYPNIMKYYKDDYQVLHIKTFLDYINQCLTLEYKFEYYDSFGILSEKPIIDRVKERNYLNFLYYLGFHENNGFKISNKQDIYHFIDKKIHKLRDFSDVFLSDNLKQMPVKKLKNFQIKFGIQNNLLDVYFDDLELSMHELQGAMKAFREQEKYYKLTDNTIISLEDEVFVNFNEVVDELDLELREDNHYIVPLYKSLGLNKFVQRYDFDDKILDFYKDLSNYKNSKIEFPKYLSDILRDYQVEAVKWLHIIAKYNLGGLLADDMGLGKTLEIISLLDIDTYAMPSIIISPTSLIFNWENEIHKFSKKLECVVVYGNIADREEIIESIDLNKKIIYITSYDSFLNDIKLYEALDYRFIILDEAQYIKNQFTKKSIAVKKLNGMAKFALTGTPIENSLADLWSIFEFIMPKYLPLLSDFKDIYEEEDGKLMQELKKKISLFILRRLKSEVLTDLKDKVIIPSYCFLGKEQRILYEGYLVQARNELKNSKNKSFQALTLLLHLRQLVCHPKLFVKSYKGNSAKLELAIEIIKEYIADGHKILLFSSFTSMLDIISKRLSNERIEHFMLTGKTSGDIRVKLTNEFNETDKAKVFLISLKAGGTGLNLTSADIVIHFDPWWNVAAENQATDRSHRIGQESEVQVIKLIAKNTIEEKIIKLQEQKKVLMEVVTQEEDVLKNLTAKEVLELFED